MKGESANSAFRLRTYELNSLRAGFYLSAYKLGNSRAELFVTKKNENSERKERNTELGQGRFCRSILVILSVIGGYISKTGARWVSTKS